MITPTPEQHAALIKATHRHKELDILVRGTYGKYDGDEFKACSVGCLAYDIDPEADENQMHKMVSDFYGYPEWLVYLQDTLFESADRDIHVKLAQAIKPRDNWRSVMHIIHWRILNEVSLPTAGNSTDAVKRVMELHKQESDNQDEWSAAWSAAESAAASVAESAAWSAARSAAWSAAGSAAESAAESAARSAAWSAAGSVTQSAAWKTIMNIVLEEISR